MNWDPIERLRDQTIELSDRMFHYMLDGLAEAGVDITNPIELMVVLKAIDPFTLEKLFHPSIVEDGNETIVPLMPAALWNATQNELANQITLLKDTKYPGLLKDHRICVASADVHFAGAAVIAGVMKLSLIHICSLSVKRLVITLMIPVKYSSEISCCK